MRIKLIPLVVLSAAALAHAHGVQIQLTYDPIANRIDTRSIVYTSANDLGQPVPINYVSPQRRAYIEPLLYSPIGSGTGWYARPAPKLVNGVPEHPTGPGITQQYDSVVPGTGWAYSGSATLPNLAGTSFSYKLLDGLKQWDPATATFVDPGAEQVQVFASSGTSSFTKTATNSVTTRDVVGGTGPQDGTLVLAAGTSLTNPHSSVSVRLLGDGVTPIDGGEGDDGIYLVKLALSTTATVGNTGVPVGNSDPFYFVLTKNASYADALAATASLGIAPSLVQGQVPEPTSLATIGGIALLVRRRRRTIAAIACSALASPALAHEGPRVWVTQNNGQLVTERSDDDFDPSTYVPARVFTGELSPYFGTYTTQFPGYEAPRDGSGGVGDGTWVGFKIAGPLLTLDAGGTRLVPTAERFAGAAAPQLSITFPDVPPAQATAYTRRTSAGVVGGYDFTNTVTEHSHLAYTLLGDGTSSSAPSADGVYVLPMVLTSPTLATSDWYFLTFKKNASDATLGVAVSIAGRMAVATPGDANFDGAVNFDDLLTLAQRYSTTTGAWWATGDFNFDGAVGFDDLLALAQHYGGSGFEADWSLAQSLVPEPGTVVLLGIARLVRRRRR